MTERDKEIERYKKALGVAVDALNFYADPRSYHAVAFLFDKPCGDFASDFSKTPPHGYGRPMAGKAARAALSKLERRYGGLKFYSHADGETGQTK